MGSSPSTLDARVEKTRRALRAALLGLLEEEAFDRISIRQICARADCGYATFFRHYPDKEALLHDLAAAEIGELLSRSIPIFYEVDSRASCIALCEYVGERHRLWSALLTGGAAGILREEFIRKAREAVPDDAQTNSSLPPDLAMVAATSAVIEILAWWLDHRGEYSAEEIADFMDRIAITPSVTG